VKPLNEELKVAAHYQLLTVHKMVHLQLAKATDIPNHKH
jgi:hypothetical protein